MFPLLQVRHFGRIYGIWYLKEATAKTSKILKKLGLNLSLLSQTRERSRDPQGFPAYITYHIGSYSLNSSSSIIS